jgi:hypothetical protein
MFKSKLSGKATASRSRSKSGIVVAPPMTADFWRRVLRGQFIWCECWLLIAILCTICGAILELKGFRWVENWSVNILGLAMSNVTPGLTLMVMGLWAAKRAEFNVNQQEQPPAPPAPPEPTPDRSWFICRLLRKLLRFIFGRKRFRPGYITFGAEGIVVPGGSADKQFWELAEQYQWWFSLTGMVGGFLCEVLGILAVWLSNLATPAWHASIAGIEIDNAPVGALLFLSGIALQEFTRYEVQESQNASSDSSNTKGGMKTDST